MTAALAQNFVMKTQLDQRSQIRKSFVPVIPYTIKHSRGKTFTVRQQYSLCRENFRGLPMIVYFRAF